MIVDTIATKERYARLHPRFAQAFDFIEVCRKQKPQPGEICLDAHRLYVMVQQYDTMPPDIPAWEGHRRYIDIQYMLDGEEVIQYAPLAWALEGAQYHPENDFLHCGVKAYMNIVLRRDQFAVFYPEDLHKPKCRVLESCPVNKLVVKVELE